MTITSLSNTSTEQEVYIFPASFAQQRLWFLDQLEPNNPAYTVFSTAHISGPLNLEALKQSFQAIIERHEVLRTTFTVSDGQPMQVIAPTLSVPLTLVDLEQLPETQRQAGVLRLANEEVKRPFDLAEGPLLRTTLLKLGPQQHILLLCVHHIVFDGWSNRVFFQELETCYRAFAGGQPVVLPELPIQYADFMLWQREWLQGELLEEQLAYWKQQLADAPTVLDLPTDHPRPSVPTHRGSSCLFTLPSSLTEALKALSQQHRVSLFMTLTAAFQTLLYRYSGQEDQLLGTVTANRRHPETENLIGFFVNTLVLHTDLSGDPTFRELLARVRTVILTAQDHQDVPFEYLVKELQPDRSLGQNPFFQVMLVLEPPKPDLTSGWNLTHMDLKTDATRFDLDLIFHDFPEGLQGRLTYSTDLFEEATIRRMIGHWRTLLEGIVAHPEQHLSELPLLTEAERHQLLIEWNATSTHYPEDQTVHQLFEEQVERTPDAVAVIFESQQLTYRELNTRANQLAHCLRQLGVAPDALVGLCMKRSLDMVVALLSILKAGGAYVPLDPAYPQERLAFMLQDTKLAVLLTQQQLIETLPTHGLHVLCLDTDWEEIAQQDERNLINSTLPEHLVYVLYTSGSTGRPKGVAITHRSVVAFTHWALTVFTPEELAGVLASTSICFDISVFEIFVPLSCGGKMILVENVLHLPSVAASGKVTLINSVPSALTEVVHSRGIPASVHIVNLAGEPLHSVLVQQLYQLKTIQRVYNFYGPTETTIYATYALVEDGERKPLIGRPIANTQLYITDAHFQPVPIGVPGELYIGGVGVARGYLNRPELTQEKFITNPFSDGPGTKLYKTGDRVRYLADGTIEFLGRFDHQVKIRGFRIELGEIEVVLGQHPAVREAVLVVHEHGDKRLVAYVVPLTEQKVTSNELRSFLKERLPEYMIPSDFVLLDSMPLTPNGKADRHALPAPDPTGHSAQDSFVAPTSLLHHQLKKIWEDLLGVRPIGIRDNFFALGGHSLLAVRMIDRFERAYGKKLPLATLFAGATIEHLADVLLKEEVVEENSDVRTKVVTVQPGGSKRPFFLLHGDWRGGGVYCLNLAQALEADQPFYALEPYRFEDLRVPPSFETIAEAHIQAMRAVQPQGPYLLGGYCNGGLLAYEMARQLHAQGQKVDLLVLIDPAAPYAHRLNRDILNRLGNLLRLGEDKQVNVFLRYIYMRLPSFRRAVQELAGLKAIEPTESERKNSKVRFALARLKALFPSIEALRYNWFGIYRWVAAGYVPGPYPGKLTIFWSSERGNRHRDWRQLSGSQEVEEHTFPGVHVTYRNENLHVLAEGLNACLVKAQATTADTLAGE